MFVDSFSGEVSELKGKNRTDENILKVLAKSPMVSTWDMSENAWLWKAIARLKDAGLLIEIKQGYPWHKYEVVVKGE